MSVYLIICHTVINLPTIYLTVLDFNNPLELGDNDIGAATTQLPRVILEGDFCYREV